MTHEELQEELNATLIKSFNSGHTLAEVVGILECTKLAIIDGVVGAVGTKKELAEGQQQQDGNQ